MAISLNKGGKLSLSKEAPDLKKVLVGLGWDARATDGADFDLDASAFLLDANGKVRSDADFIFYNNLKSADGSVEHTGDNRTGEGDGDVQLSKAGFELEAGDYRVKVWAKSSAPTYAHLIARDEPHPFAAAYRLDRFASGRVIDEKGMGAQPNLQ